MEDVDGKTFGVLGLARSGIACAEVLTARGARVVLYDGKPAEQLGEALAAAGRLGVEARVGGAAIEYGELDALITSPGVPRWAPELQGAVQAGVPVWGEIEAAYRISRAPIVAITGTNGKTTTTVIVAEMLRAAGYTAHIGGNIAAGTLAQPLIKACHIAEPEDVIVAEISSFQLEWIESFRPRVGAILNITPDHGDRQSWEEYVAAKWNLFQFQRATDLAVVRDDVPADPILAFALTRLVTFNAADAVRIIEDVVPVSQVRLPGQHNRENIAAAILMTRDLGATDDAIRRVVTTFGGVVHRLEFVAEAEGVTYINNSMCTNVDAFKRSLEAIASPKVVIAGGVFKGDDLQSLADAVIGGGVRAMVLIGRSAPAIEGALRASGYGDVRGAASLAEAVRFGREAALPGDTVMLAPACASFDMFKDFEDRGDQFKAMVRELCETRRQD
jgi:UDP-N-acetylmuramoylalanine--D-glutamate ligase